MLGNKFKEVIANLEKNIQNKQDLEYVKKQVTELTMSYLDELEKIEQNYDFKVSRCSERIEDLEKAVNDVRNKVNHEEEIDVEPITCPYCNSRFLIEFDNKQKEIKCPDCKNIIELDWENYDDM